MEGDLSLAYGGEQVSMQFSGATSKRGEWFSMRSSGIPDGGDFSMQVLIRGGRAWTNLGGGWQSGPAPSEVGSSGTMSAAAFQQLARYVKDVREFGDIEAVLTIDERTHLLDSAFVTFSVAAEGQQVDLELRYRLTSANEPVELPTP